MEYIRNSIESFSIQHKAEFQFPHFVVRDHVNNFPILLSKITDLLSKTVTLVFPCPSYSTLHKHYLFWMSFLTNATQSSRVVKSMAHKFKKKLFPLQCVVRGNHEPLRLIIYSFDNLMILFVFLSTTKIEMILSSTIFNSSRSTKSSSVFTTYTYLQVCLENFSTFIMHEMGEFHVLEAPSALAPLLLQYLA